MVHGLLRQLGVSRYCMTAHDVGAWVAYLFDAADRSASLAMRLNRLNASLKPCVVKPGRQRFARALHR